MSTYTIELKGGKRIENVAMNGSMFVAPEEITMEDLNSTALEQVTITEIPDEGEPTTTILENTVCDGIKHWPEGYLFNIREKTTEEKQASEIEQLKDENRMLVECILEISEEVWK